MQQEDRWDDVLRREGGDSRTDLGATDVEQS